MLSLGSVLYLKDGDKKVMITSRGSVVEHEGETYLFDYGACLYPEGDGVEDTLYFNESEVGKVLFEGYVDEDELRIRDLYVKWKKDNIAKYKVYGEHNLLE